jgi:hypothetical protein
LEVHGLDTVEALFAVLIPEGEGREEQGLRDLVGDIDDVVGLLLVYVLVVPSSSVDLLDEPAPTGLVVPARARGPVAGRRRGCCSGRETKVCARVPEKMTDVHLANRAIG